MPSYTPPLRDMQFVLHEVFHVADAFKAMPAHADTDAERRQVAAREAITHPCLHLQRGVAQADGGTQRAPRVVIAVQRGTELGHDRIADELVNGTALPLHDRAGSRH